MVPEGLSKVKLWLMKCWIVHWTGELDNCNTGSHICTDTHTHTTLPRYITDAGQITDQTQTPPCLQLHISDGCSRSARLSHVSLRMLFSKPGGPLSYLTLLKVQQKPGFNPKSRLAGHKLCQKSPAVPARLFKASPFFPSPTHST